MAGLTFYRSCLLGRPGPGAHSDFVHGKIRGLTRPRQRPSANANQERRERHADQKATIGPETSSIHGSSLAATVRYRYRT